MQSRNLAIDIFKIILACIVVCLHGEFLRDISSEGHFLTVHGVFRVAVPLFFIINGYYFKSIENISQLKKWVKRILLLYVFWMIFYSYSIIGVSFKEIILRIIFGYAHLWYLVGMIGAGILTLLLRDRVKLGLILSIICFVLGVAIQYLGNYHVFNDPILDELANTHFVHRNFLFLAFPFFYIGFVIKKYGDFKDIKINLLIFMSIIGMGLLIAESYYNYHNKLNDGGFDNYLSLGLVCPILFLIIIRSKLTTPNRNLALISTAIFFIHIFWLHVFRALAIFGDTGITIMCILFSFLSTYIIIQIDKKVKFIL